MRKVYANVNIEIPVELPDEFDTMIDDFKERCVPGSYLKVDDSYAENLSEWLDRYEDKLSDSLPDAIERISGAHKVIYILLDDEPQTLLYDYDC